MGVMGWMINPVRMSSTTTATRGFRFRLRVATVESVGSGRNISGQISAMTESKNSVWNSKRSPWESSRDNTDRSENVEKTRAGSFSPASALCIKTFNKTFNKNIKYFEPSFFDEMNISSRSRSSSKRKWRRDKQKFEKMKMKTCGSSCSFNTAISAGYGRASPLSTSSYVNNFSSVKDCGIEAGTGLTKSLSPRPILMGKKSAEMGIGTHVKNRRRRAMVKADATPTSSGDRSSSHSSSSSPALSSFSTSPTSSDTSKPSVLVTASSSATIPGPVEQDPITTLIGKLGGSHAPPISDMAWTAAGAFISVAVLAAMDRFLAPRGLSMTMGSHGAVTVLLLAAPAAAVSQRWNIFVSHIGCALIGVTAFCLWGPGWMTRGVALAASVAFMQFTGSLHPPATALPFLFIEAPTFQTLKWWYVIFPGASGCLVVVCVAALLNILRSYLRRKTTAKFQ